MVRNFPQFSAIFRNFRNFPQFSAIFRNFPQFFEFLGGTIPKTTIFEGGLEASIWSEGPTCEVSKWSPTHFWSKNCIFIKNCGSASKQLVKFLTLVTGTPVPGAGSTAIFLSSDRNFPQFFPQFSAIFRNFPQFFEGSSDRNFPPRGTYVR